MTDPRVEIWIGSDAWRSAKLEAARAAAEEWTRIREDERTPGRIYEALRAYSFFQMSRTVVIDAAETLVKEEQGELTEALKALAPGVHVLLLAKPGRSADKLGELLGAAEVPGGVRSQTEDARKSERPEDLARSRGFRLTPELANLLAEQLGQDPMAMRLEVEKLELLAEGGEVDLDAWREVSAAGAAVDGWRFARAVMARDVGAAWQALEQWVALGGNASSAGRDLVGAVGYVVRQYLSYRLLVATGSSPDEAARRTPGRFMPADRAAAGRWTVPALAEALTGLVELDRELKSVPLPAEHLLFRWCLRVAHA